MKIAIQIGGLAGAEPGSDAVDPLRDPDELNEHRLRTAGDFYLKRSERHVHHPTDHPDSDANRRFTDVALQLQLGILPKRRFRLDLDHCACVGLGGPRIAAQDCHGLPHRQVIGLGAEAVGLDYGCDHIAGPFSSGRRVE